MCLDYSAQGCFKPPQGDSNDYLTLTEFFPFQIMSFVDLY